LRPDAIVIASRHRLPKRTFIVDEGVDSMKFHL
jgi:hypothetical protein